MAEPAWSGSLHLSPVACRVKLVPAVSDPPAIRLEPINIATGNPVTAGFVDAVTGEPVAPEAIGQAHRYDNGRFVTISEAELRELAGPPSETIEIDDFVPLGSVDRLLHERLYYLDIAEPAAGDALAAIAAVLQRQGRAGLGRMHLDGRQRRVLIEPRDGGLVLAVLRSAARIAVPQFAASQMDGLPSDTIAMLEATVERQSTAADPAALADPYEDGLRMLIAEKIRDARAAEAPPPDAVAAGEREFACEIFISAIGAGESRHVGGGWAGTQGSGQPIEALSIRPGEGLASGAIEFRVFAGEGRATAWVADGNYAGSWGRGLPLTGFAVRPSADHTVALETVYQGCFSKAGTVGPKRDGEACVSPEADDTLEAVLIRVLERAE